MFADAQHTPFASVRKYCGWIIFRVAKRDEIFQHPNSGALIAGAQRAPNQPIAFELNVFGREQQTSLHRPVGEFSGERVPQGHIRLGLRSRLNSLPVRHTHIIPSSWTHGLRCCYFEDDDDELRATQATDSRGNYWRPGWNPRRLALQGHRPRVCALESKRLLPCTVPGRLPEGPAPWRRASREAGGVVSPPARSGQDLRLSPVKGIALSHKAYDLRGRDGYLICSVARAKAEQGIAAGTLELRMNSSGAYLAAVDLGYPPVPRVSGEQRSPFATIPIDRPDLDRSEEHTSELQ